MIVDRMKVRLIDKTRHVPREVRLDVTLHWTIQSVSETITSFDVNLGPTDK